MRVGDFSVEVVAVGGEVRELDSGHVLARAGQMYTLRVRNHGPLRAVADISIDGHAVTGGGLVIDPWSSVDLERPIHATERGRFTVIAEGNEQVFGPDGGRDNTALGLIEARFRRELPSRESHDVYEPVTARPIVTLPSPEPRPSTPDIPPRYPFTPPEWTPPTWEMSARFRAASRLTKRHTITGLMASPVPVTEPATPVTPEGDALPAHGDGIERAAGTGLTGTSAQEFTPVRVGALESEATVIRLRLVIAAEGALDAARSLPGSDAVPARPAPRP